MPRRSGLDLVRAIGRTLPDVEETTTWGAFSLKVRGKLFVCTAINKAAEPNSLMVRMDFAQRDALLAEAPETYYLKEHYANYPCVLVRLSKVHPDALRDLVVGAHRLVSATLPTRRRLASSRGPSARRERATNRHPR